MQDPELADGIAIVTGAAGGMGSECARRMIEGGWRELLLCDLDEARLASAAQTLRVDGIELATLAGDIADAEFPARLIDRSAGRDIGALIHTAGLGPQMAPPDTIFDVNLDAGLRLLATARSRMAAGGAIVMFASIAGYFPVSPEADLAFDSPIPPDGSASLRHFAADSNDAYLLAKRAILATVRREANSLFAERGARIVSVSPGMIETAMTRDVKDARTMAMLHDAPIPRLGRPEEVAAACVFLCSPSASFITGSDLQIDGGVLASLGLR